MAIEQTGAIYKSFTFDGIDSRDYGVYISGDAVFDAPERDVEMIEIPGRNGAYALDNGRFHNITVTYPAGIFGGSESDFAQGISDLRNALASRKGYCRLEDEYNPGEYRMAVYKSGLEVTPAQLKAGEFSIVFDCKPQRFLKSGEDAVRVNNNDTITNDTQFDAQPLLQVWGHGNIDIGGQGITVENIPVGNVLVMNQVRPIEPGNRVFTLDTSQLEIGDTIGADAVLYLHFGITPKTGYRVKTAPDYQYSASNALENTFGTAHTFTINGWGIPPTIPVVMTDGTNDYNCEYRINVEVKYDGADRITVRRVSVAVNTFGNYATVVPMFGSTAIYADSTKSALGTPLYIDCEMGEAYKLEGGEIISSNAGVSLPASLPVLHPGANVVGFDNTVTKLMVAPRWWIV